jgi:hypothetical protein
MNAISGIGIPWGQVGKFLQQVGKFELAARVLRPIPEFIWERGIIIMPEKGGEPARAGSCWRPGHIDLQA